MYFKCYRGVQNEKEIHNRQTEEEEDKRDVIFMNKETLQTRQKVFPLIVQGGDEWGEVKLKGCEGWCETGREGRTGMGLIGKNGEDSKVESGGGMEECKSETF